MVWNMSRGEEWGGGCSDFDEWVWWGGDVGEVSGCKVVVDSREWCYWYVYFGMLNILYLMLWLYYCYVLVLVEVDRMCVVGYI